MCQEFSSLDEEVVIYKKIHDELFDVERKKSLGVFFFYHVYFVFDGGQRLK